MNPTTFVTDAQTDAANTHFPARLYAVHIAIGRIHILRLGEIHILRLAEVNRTGGLLLSITVLYEYKY